MGIWTNRRTPHLCIVCFITFLDSYKAKLVLVNFNKNLGFGQTLLLPFFVKAPLMFCPISKKKPLLGKERVRHQQEGLVPFVSKLHHSCASHIYFVIREVICALIKWKESNFVVPVLTCFGWFSVDAVFAMAHSLHNLVMDKCCQGLNLEVISLKLALLLKIHLLA